MYEMLRCWPNRCPFSDVIMHFFEVEKNAPFVCPLGVCVGLKRALLSTEHLLSGK